MDGESRKRAIQIARNLLEERIDCLAATRALLTCLHADATLVFPEDIKTLRGIDSETDDLPVGIAREQWHPDALLEKDNEISRCEQLYGSRVRSICQKLLENLGQEP
jgi:hypothetical protein